MSSSPSDEGGSEVPFGWRDHFNNAGLHSIIIDPSDEFLKGAELIHRLQRISHLLSRLEKVHLQV